MESSQEQSRLRSLRDLGQLDTYSDPNIERICQLVEHAFGVMSVTVSLLDEHRQWFKRKSGIVSVCETPREWAFCNYTIEQNEIFEVTNALEDQRFAANPLVTSEPHVRYYAGAPILLSDGYSPGSLCLLNDRPRPPLSHSNRTALGRYAALVAREFEVTKMLKRAVMQLGQAR